MDAIIIGAFVMLLMVAVSSVAFGISQMKKGGLDAFGDDD